MANATRMQIAQSATIYHRITANNDFDIHDVATNEALASGLGSSADFQLHNVDDITYVSQHQLVTTTRDELDAGGTASTSCTAFIYIKNTGFTTSDKDTVSTAYLKIDSGESCDHAFTLFPKESILLHNLGTAVDEVQDWFGDSSSGDIYVEVICGAKS